MYAIDVWDNKFALDFSEVKRTIALDFSEVTRTIHLLLYVAFVFLYDDFDCNIRFGPVIFGKLLRMANLETCTIGYTAYGTCSPKWMAVCLSWAFF